MSELTRCREKRTCNDVLVRSVVGCVTSQRLRLCVCSGLFWFELLPHGTPGMIHVRFSIKQCAFRDMDRDFVRSRQDVKACHLAV